MGNTMEHICMHIHTNLWAIHLFHTDIKNAYYSTQWTTIHWFYSWPTWRCICSEPCTSLGQSVCTQQRETSSPLLDYEPIPPILSLSLSCLTTKIHSTLLGFLKQSLTLETTTPTYLDSSQAYQKWHFLPKLGPHPTHHNLIWPCWKFALKSNICLEVIQDMDMDLSVSPSSLAIMDFNTAFQPLA